MSLLTRKEIEKNGWIYSHDIHKGQLFKKSFYILQVTDYINRDNDTNLIIAQNDYMITTLFKGSLYNKEELDFIERKIKTWEE